MAGLGRELYDFLVNAFYAQPGPCRQRSVWVMNPEWHTECHELASDLDGGHLWLPHRPDERLFGLPVMVSEDGGVPHLVLMD